MLVCPIIHGNKFDLLIKLSVVNRKMTSMLGTIIWAVGYFLSSL